MEYIVRVKHTQEFRTADTTFEQAARLAAHFVHDTDAGDNTHLTIEVIPIEGTE